MSNGNNIAPGSFTVRFIKARSVHTGRPTSETTMSLPAGTDPHAYAADRGWEVAHVDGVQSTADVLNALKLSK
ncbi:MAG TPA: hypothetical protein ENK57_14780 [Polyangiaceae bacterium]|nr:hypothetical protein [Polyangiaceae bacterium]